MSAAGVARHCCITVLVALVSACGPPAGHVIQAGVSCRPSPNPGLAGQASSAMPARYSIAGGMMRHDTAPIYVLVIEPVEASNDGFKASAKGAVAAIADQNGGADFGAWVFDDRDVARVAFDESRTATADTTPAKSRSVLGQHLIASYSGGDIGANDRADCLINWFPAATPDMPNVGRWANSSETWNPLQSVE